MEILRNSLNPEALELRKSLDRKGGNQAPDMETIHPSSDGNRLERRAAKALARRQRKRAAVQV
jgi:hypothetical protein